MYVTLFITEKPPCAGKLNPKTGGIVVEFPKGARSSSADVTPPECTRSILLMRMQGLFRAAVRTMEKYGDYPGDLAEPQKWDERSD